jgi:hypothetical protein
MHLLNIRRNYMMRVKVALCIAGFLLVWIGCKESKECPVVASDPIMVDEIVVLIESTTPLDTIPQGKTVTLTAKVTTAPTVGALTYRWFSEYGHFHSTTGDTVEWKAPDEAGVYSIGVHVEDGENDGVGRRAVGVEVFAPYVEPYFAGGTNCNTCHASKDAAWMETAHAHAWATLQNSGHPAPYCNRCHTVDNAETPGNSGYDDAPIALYENVQCENCHGPASAHLESKRTEDISVDFSAANCGVCHEGTHHPYLTEWSESPHNFDETSAHDAPTNGGCQGCHEGVSAAERLADEAGLAQFYGGAPYGTAARDTVGNPIQPIVCSTCHDPHTADNPGQVRTIANVPLIEANNESPVIIEGGVGKLCMQCHHARHSADEHIPAGDDHFGPHGSPQADMMKGATGSHGVADATFVWAGPSHLHVQNSCKTCHLNTIEYISEEQPTVTGHRFEPTVAACANCHGTIEDFDNILAVADFDGDGQIEGIQSEVTGLLHVVEEALVADGLDTTATDFETALGDTLKSNVKQRTAGFNLVFVEADKSLGVHNPDYAIQLLQQSYKYLTGHDIPHAVILRKEEGMVAVRF